MAGRKYTPEFRANAVALWRASAGQRTMKDVAADLGITRETLRLWVRAADGGTQVPAGGAGAEDHRDELVLHQATFALVTTLRRCSSAACLFRQMM
ncbi:transposase [Streptacidiphilus sp. P02-A3a]|nr:transposase [Streptacidiphilus sp. P02-A3a]QMU71812.1 transposase [Streptacidiphilus sp. P02-A3a]